VILIFVLLKFDEEVVFREIPPASFLILDTFSNLPRKVSPTLPPGPDSANFIILFVARESL
jgi:hypothetical protein